MHRVACPLLSDPVEQLPVVPKAPASPPRTLGPLPPIIHPTGSSHSDPLPWGMVSPGVQLATPYNTQDQETQSDLQGYGVDRIPYLDQATRGPRMRASAHEELQRLEELERNRDGGEGGEVVTAAEHPDVDVQQKDVILRGTARHLASMASAGGGARAAVAEDDIALQLIRRYEPNQAQPIAEQVLEVPAPTASASRPPEPACGGSEAAPTAAVDPGSPPEPASNGSEAPTASGSNGSEAAPTSFADALGIPTLSQVTLSHCSESAPRNITMGTLQTVLQFSVEESTRVQADASTQYLEPAGSGSEPAGGGSELPAAAPGSALESRSPEHEALPSISEDHVGEPGQGCFLIRSI